MKVSKLLHFLLYKQSMNNTFTQVDQNNPNTFAPKDRPVLVLIGYPWPLMAIWNQFQEEFVIANLQINMMYGEYNDPYWENDYVNESDIISWAEVPVVRNIIV